MTENRSFSPRGYSTLLEDFFSLDYKVVDYPQVLPEEKHLVLRHDVDFCLGRAMQMAELEAGLGVRATYFILMSSRFYNILSAEAANALQKIQLFGHRIGLHFDPLAHAMPDHGIEMERRALEMVIGQELSMMSFHRPHQSWLNSTHRVGNLPHTYEPRFFSEIAYVSDSRGDWHYGHPLDHQSVMEGRALQLLTHPIWWMHAFPTGHTPTDVLLQYSAEQNEALQESIRANCTSYEPLDDSDILPHD